LLVAAVLIIAGCIAAGCTDEDKPTIKITNRPFLNITASEVHLEPGEEWNVDLWWETEGRQEWPDGTEYEFRFRSSTKTGKLEGYGQSVNITTEEKEPSLTYKADPDSVGYDKVEFFVMILYNGEYFNQTGSINIFVEIELKDIPIGIHGRYYRTIEDIIGTADDDSSTYTARGYFAWPLYEGAHSYEMTVHFNGNDPGNMFWYDPPRPYVYSDGDTNIRYANANQMPEGDLKGWYVGLEEHRDDYIVTLGGPSIDFEDGQWEQTDIDTVIAENETATENFFQGWTADVMVLPDDRHFNVGD